MKRLIPILLTMIVLFSSCASMRQRSGTLPMPDFVQRGEYITTIEGPNKTTEKGYFQINRYHDCVWLIFGSGDNRDDLILRFKEIVHNQVSKSYIYEYNRKVYVVIFEINETKVFMYNVQLIFHPHTTTLMDNGRLKSYEIRTKTEKN